MLVQRKKKYTRDQNEATKSWKKCAIQNQLKTVNYYLVLLSQYLHAEAEMLMELVCARVYFVIKTHTPLHCVYFKYTFYAIVYIIKSTK